MGLLKQSTPTAAAVSPFSMRDIESHAKGVLLRARQQADALLAAAQQEAAAMRRQAQDEGFAEGHEAGLQQGLTDGRATGHAAAIEEHRAAIGTAVGVLNGAMTALDAARRSLDTDALTDVIQLAIAIARRVTKRQAALDPRVLVDNLNEAMRLVVSANDLRVAIHPSQRATLDDAMPRLRVEWPALQHATIVDDDALHPGGCRIYTRQGRVDADIDVQLDRVVRDLLPDQGMASGATGSSPASVVVPLARAQDTGGQSARGTPTDSPSNGGRA